MAAAVACRPFGVGRRTAREIRRRDVGDRIDIAAAARGHGAIDDLTRDRRQAANALGAAGDLAAGKVDVDQQVRRVFEILLLLAQKALGLLDVKLRER